MLRLVNNFGMPRAGIEPARGHPHWILNPARLPISPPRHSKIQRQMNKSSGTDRLSHEVSFAVP